MTVAASAGGLLRAAGAALPSGLGLAAALGAVALLLRPESWTAVAIPAGLALAALAWARPAETVGVLLAVAPICGNRPTTGPFIAFVGLTACAVPGWLARLATRDRAVALDVLATPVGLALVAYLGASVLSLSSLPIHAPEEIVGAASLGAALRQLPAALAAADITAWIYPALTVVLTLHAAVAALVVAVAIRRDRDRDRDGEGDRDRDRDRDRDPDPDPAAPTRTAANGVHAAVDADSAARSHGPDAALAVAGGILLGLVAALAAGALDRWGYLDLRLLRATDPFTNLTGAERLQSTFGHAGWFAEYLCFATPSILALWLWPSGRGPHTVGRPLLHRALPEPRLRRVSRIAIAVCLLAASLVAIVHSYQRGGWITWALVGAGVAVAMLRLASASNDPAGKGPLRRPLLLSAGVLVLAVAAGLLVVRVAGGAGEMRRFAERARTITQLSDRQAHVTAGLRLGAQLPILGGGSESFALRYQQEYLLAGGAFYARGYSPVLDMYGSAHNVFAQTFAGKGAVGLVALVLLVLASAVAAVRVVRAPTASTRQRIVAMIAFGTIAAFTIYGQVQEVFYIAPLQLTVFAAFGMAAALERPIGSPERACRRLGIVAGVLVAGLAAHLVHGYVLSGRLADDYHDRAITRAGARLSPPVIGEDGQYFQWTGARAVVTVPRQATELSFDLQRSGGASRDVEVRFDGRLIDRVRLDDDGWRHVVYPLRRVRTLPRRFEIVVGPVGADAAALPGSAGMPGAARRTTGPSMAGPPSVTGGTSGTVDRGVAVRRIRWGME